MKVLKFGGSSVASPERIRSVIDSIRHYLPGRIALVFSAFGGVTDQLIRMSEEAVSGRTEYKGRLIEVGNRHVEAVRSLIDVNRQSAVLARVKIQLNELEDILQGVYLVRECTPRTRDYIMGFGERLSAYIISECINQAGMEAAFVDARTLIRTDSQFGHAAVDFEKTNQLIVEQLGNLQGIPVITGFIAQSANGESTTLGRSGSDYTAAIVAGALRATDLEIWTDVDGMMTADPRRVPQAFTIPELSYEEAMELSHFGAKVIFPSTMRPAMIHRIPIWVKNTFRPQVRGTRISADPGNGRLIKGISSISSMSLLTIQGSGMVGVVGVSQRLFSRLALGKVNIVMISQASSEHSICIAIDSQQAVQAQQLIEQEFETEIQSRQIDPVVVTNQVAIIAIVGDGMKHHAGTAGRMFGALGKAGINVVAIAQGSSERNISAVIDAANTDKALSVLHDAFFLSDKKIINLFLAGTGLIGSTLLKQMRKQHTRLYEEHHLDIRLAGVINSRRMLLRREGIAEDDMPQTLQIYGEPANLFAFCEGIRQLNLANSIFVDCTASDAVAHQYESLLSASVSVVTPNKKANAASLHTYRQLRKVARDHDARFLYETNVGAGLPVINTLHDLLLSGDTVIRIEAVLSGTLNFIFSSFQADARFSEVVREAKARGFTEPDPRDDLSGTDVARKILILARECGLPAELDDVTTESLVPADCRGEMSSDEFLTRLAQHDEVFQQRVQQAAARHGALRYAAVFENNTLRVGLQEVQADHPFYSLSGSDNIILLTTQRYHDRPMVIRGPGAGAEVTAAGVFADIIRIGNYVPL